jgi:ankyrin repeat protein
MRNNNRISYEQDKKTASFNNTPFLLEAIKHGREKEVEMLLARGAEVNEEDKGKTRIVKPIPKFPQRGAPPITGSPLLIAIKYGHERIVEMLLNHGARVNQINTDDSKTNLEDRIKTPLLAAVEVGNERIVEILLNNSAEVNQAADNSQITPLITAAKYGNAKIAELLLRHGANVNQKVDGHTFMVRTGEINEVICMLVNSDKPVEHTPLLIAAKNNDKADLLIGTLLKYGALIREEDIILANKALVSALTKVKYLQEVARFLKTNPLNRENELATLNKEFQVDLLYPAPNKTYKIVDGKLQDGEKVFSLVDLCTSEFGAVTLKGMIFAHGLPYQVAKDFIKQVMRLEKDARIPDDLAQLHLDLSEVESILDKIKLFAVKDNSLKAKEFSRGEGDLAKLQTFSDRSTYYEALLEANKAANMSAEALRAQYPHPLDTSEIKEFFSTHRLEDLVEEIVRNLVINSHEISGLERSIAQGVLSAEMTTFFHEILCEYSKIKETMKPVYTTATAASSSDLSTPISEPEKQFFEEEGRPQNACEYVEGKQETQIPVTTETLTDEQ